MNTMNTLGNLLKNRRKEKKLTLVQLADKLELTHGYLSNVENGNRNPSPEVLKKLSVALDIEYTELLHEAGYEELHKAARLVQAFDDFKDELDVSDTYLRMSALEEAIDIENFLRQESHLLQSENVLPYYKGHLLTEQDRKRILTMLEVLFPEYQNRKE